MHCLGGGTGGVAREGCESGAVRDEDCLVEAVGGFGEVAGRGGEVEDSRSGVGSKWRGGGSLEAWLEAVA